MSNLPGNFKISVGDVQSVDVLREREQERRARMQLLDDIREPSPQPIFGEPVKVDLEDETSRRIKNTLGDFTQVLVNDPKNLIGISRSTPAGHLVNGHPSNGYVAAGHPVNGYMVAGHLTTGHSGHPGHQMTGYVSSGSSGYSSHGSSGYSSTHSGYSSTHSSSSGMGSSSSYGRTQAALKKPPFANGANMAKSSMPNYISPKGPDKRSTSYKIPLQSSYTSSPAATKPSHSSGLQQLPYQVQDIRIRDSVPWDGKDQRRVNSIPVAATNANVENYVAMNIVNNNNGLSTSAPIWNCGPDTPAIQIAPFHLPSSVTPSVPCKEAAKHGQIPTSIPPATTTAAKIESATPAKRNSGRPSNLKIQPERKTSTDAPIAVETILKQMTDVVPPAPLTGIQTPRKEETGFAFTSEPKEVDSFLKDTKDVPSSYFVETITLLSPKPQWEPEPVAITEVQPVTVQIASPEKPEPVVAESTAKTNDSDKSVSLQDDLAVSDSEDEAVLELKNNPEKCLKSPLRDTTEITVNSTVLGSSINNMEDNSAESSNSSSSEDSDSDDSSSESNDSDSSSEASDEEISSKKWGLSNFVDESQRIYSPAFIPADPAKDSSKLFAEKTKNSVLNNVNSLNGALPVQDTFHQPVTETTSFLVPEVPVTAKSEILSPIPSPVRTQVGPRTPPSPPCPLKQESPETNKTDTEVLSSEAESKFHDETFKSPNKNSPQSEKPQDNRDISADKGNVQNEKCKKQLRSSKSKELNSEAESTAAVSSDESSNVKEPSGTILEKDKIFEKSTPSAVISATSETRTENYPIKTRQRVSAATRRKSAVDNISESSQKPEEANSAIAKLKHPRACRKSTEKQNKKPIDTPNSIKLKPAEEPKKHTKQETKDSVNVTEKTKTTPKPLANVKTSSKTTPVKTSTRSKGKSSKVSPKQLLEDKKPEIKKKKKKFAIKNFVQSHENESAKPPTTASPFTPSPERSPIPESQKDSETPEETTSVSPDSCKPQSKSNIKSPVKVKKVEKLRRSVRCSERASNNAQVDPSTNQQTTESKETKKNPKNIGKTKRSAENVSISIEPPVELLSPIPHDPSLSSQSSDSAIPVKIMVCIPLNMLSRYPGSSQQPQDSAAKQMPKSTSASEEVNTQKKDTAEKPIKNTTVKSTPLIDKNKTTLSIKNDDTISKNIKAKTKKDIKLENESSVKVKAGSNVNKSIKNKDKAASADNESKLPKKRKNESEEKQNVKKPKISLRSIEDKKLKEQSSTLKSGPSSNNDDPNKSKVLERCDSTGSLSSLCSQQSQRSSKSSKDRKNYSPVGAPESKRIKTSASPLLSAKDIKQEKLDRPKTHSTIDKNVPVDKKTKTKDKLGLMDVVDQVWDESQYRLFDDSCKKEDSNGKQLGSNQNLTEPANKGLANWDNFAPEMHKEMKEAPALNKHNPQAPVMPMDYYYTEGKKQKLIALKEKDPFQQAIKFFEAAVLFILTSQQREEYSKDTDTVYQFYNETLKFSETHISSKVKNLQTCPGGTDFKLLILCLKCQSILSVKLYNLKIKEIKEQLDGVAEFLQIQCPTAIIPFKLQSHQSRFSSFFDILSPHSTIPSPVSNSQNSNSDRNQSVSVSQSILDTICRQHTQLINLHRGHDLWEQADMYMTRSNSREFFKEVADQMEPLTLHSSITELVKYIQKGLSLVKKSFR